MVSKVADVLLVAEVNAEGHRVVRLPFLASSRNGTPCKVIPAGTDARLRRNSSATATSSTTTLCKYSPVKLHNSSARSQSVSDGIKLHAR